MFISPAFAQAISETGEAAAQAPGLMSIMTPLLVIFVIFFFMVIHPQNKRIREHHKMVSNLQKGDKVVTGGGIYATVKKLPDDETMVLDIGNGTEVTVLRHTIMQVRESAHMKAEKAKTK